MHRHHGEGAAGGERRSAAGVQEGEVFLQVFQHVDLVTVPDEEGGEDSAGVMFSYASSLWTVPVGTNIGLGPR